MKTRSHAILGGMLTAILSLAFCLPVLAYTIDSVSEMPNKEDFMVGPGKNELLLAPGESATRTFSVTNRYPNEKKFQLLVEDFTGSRDPQNNITMLGDAKGPYSLKDFLHPEIMSFTLQHGDRITIPVRIEIPTDAQPGGLYGAVVIKEVPLGKEEGGEPQEDVQSGITVEARIATLFFVRVKGQANEDGKVKEFTSDQKIYGQPPIKFRLIYENNGNVYLSPYGQIIVNNAIGTKVGELNIDPYIVMPDSVRFKELVMDRGFMFGRYTATLTLHRGYLEKDVTDTQTIAFWVLPWQTVTAIVLVIFIILLLLAGIIRWFHKNFERKPKNTNKK